MLNDIVPVGGSPSKTLVNGHILTHVSLLLLSNVANICTAIHIFLERKGLIIKRANHSSP